jgi:hypothetical protein
VSVITDKEVAVMHVLLRRLAGWLQRPPVDLDDLDGVRARNEDEPCAK